MQLPTWLIFPSVAWTVIEYMLHSFHKDTTSTGVGFFLEESRMELPDWGVSSGAAHYLGSQGMTVTGLAHPWPTVYMGWSE